MKAPPEGRTTFRLSLTAYGFFGAYTGGGFEKGAADPVDFPDLMGAIAVARIQAALVAGDSRYFGRRRVGVVRVDHYRDRLTFRPVFEYEIAEDSNEITASGEVEELQ